LVWKFGNNPAKMWMGSMALASAHHFVIYARHVADELERDCIALETQTAAGITELAQAAR
jgi:hypothetical protein